VQADGRIRLLTNRTAHDHTTRMHGYARRRVEELVDDALVGFVLKKDSPTCAGSSASRCTAPPGCP
jgi:uncharacterized protein YbbK (DUF523 family)